VPYADPEQRITYQRAYREANREKALAYQRAYYAANPEPRLARARAYKKANPEKARVLKRAWNKANPEKNADHSAERRARERGMFVEHVDRQVVFKRDRGICQICNSPVDPNDYHIDHIIPLDPGEHSYANIQLAHPSCNKSKGRK
jgi:5-methylcytosine-specific restriction endonuclease McrA